MLTDTERLDKLERLLIDCRNLSGPDFILQVREQMGVKKPLLFQVHSHTADSGSSEDLRGAIDQFLKLFQLP